MLQLEAGRWMLTLGGILGDHPPTDPDGFLGFARSLRFPTSTRPSATPSRWTTRSPSAFPVSVRHRYERLDRFPDGLLVMGDAVCSFDPVYGQGMTVAALEALTLQRHLQPGTPRAGPFFADLAGVVDVPWDIAVGGDLVYPGVEGRRTLRSRLINTYLGRLHAAAGDRDAVPAAPTWADHAS